MRFLRVSLRAVLAAALVVAAAAFLTGGTVTAVRTREGSATVSAGCAGERSPPGCAPAGWARGSTGTSGCCGSSSSSRLPLALTLWPSPTAGVVLLLAVLALVCLAVVEFLGRPPGPTAPEAACRRQARPDPRDREPGP